MIVLDVVFRFILDTSTVHRFSFSCFVSFINQTACAFQIVLVESCVFCMFLLLASAYAPFFNVNIYTEFYFQSLFLIIGRYCLCTYANNVRSVLFINFIKLLCSRFLLCIPFRFTHSHSNFVVSITFLGCVAYSFTFFMLHFLRSVFVHFHHILFSHSLLFLFRYCSSPITFDLSLGLSLFLNYILFVLPFESV